MHVLLVYQQSQPYRRSDPDVDNLLTIQVKNVIKVTADVHTINMIIPKLFTR